jgi:predicted RNA-binding protein Jag
MNDTLIQTFEKFLKYMNISVDGLTVNQWSDGDYQIDIKTPDSALLIGIHGQNIQALSHIFSRMSEKLLWAHTIVHLEINDYMKEKDAKFFKYLDSRIEIVMKTGKELTIPNLNSYERKRAHDYISEKQIAWLRTFSQGEWSERMLHIASDGIALVKKPQEWGAHSHLIIEEDGIGI